MCLNVCVYVCAYVCACVRVSPSTDGVSVDGCVDGGNVAATGLVEQGMEILFVNDESVMGLGKASVVQMMKSGAGHCRLTLIKYDSIYGCMASPNVNETEMFTVVLNTPLGIQFKHNRITGLVQGGNADASGQMSIGMAILAVNTQSCRGMSQSDIMGLIKAQGGQRISLRLGKVGLNSTP